MRSGEVCFGESCCEVKSVGYVAFGECGCWCLAFGGWGWLVRGVASSCCVEVFLICYFLDPARKGRKNAIIDVSGLNLSSSY